MKLVSNRTFFVDDVLFFSSRADLAFLRGSLKLGKLREYLILSKPESVQAVIVIIKLVLDRSHLS